MTTTKLEIANLKVDFCPQWKTYNDAGEHIGGAGTIGSRIIDGDDLPDRLREELIEFITAVLENNIEKVNALVEAGSQGKVWNY